MQRESSNTSNENIYSHSLKTKENNNICKDGFCSMPSQKKEGALNKDEINLFDPI